MILKRPLIAIPAVLALVALAIVALIWLAARTPMARNIVARHASDAVGLPATIGSMRLGLVPSPTLEIRGLRIAQTPGFGREPLVEVARARVSVPWRSLFGAGAVRELSITGATLRLRVGGSGDANWSHLFPDEPAAPVGGTPVPATAPVWSVGRFALEQGAIEFEDESEGSRWRLTAISVEARNVAAASRFPLELRLAGIFGTNTIHSAMKAEALLDVDAGRFAASDLAFRGWAGGDPMPLAGVEWTGRMSRAAFERSTGIATLVEGRFDLAGIPAAFSGTVNFAAPEIEADLRVVTEEFAPRPPAVAFGHPLPATADPEAWRAAQLSVRGRMVEGELHLDPVSGRVDDTRFEGRVVPGERLVRARIDRIDVNRYLPAATRGASTRQKKATLEDAIANLAKLDIDAEIRVGDARVGGAKLRDAVIRIEPESGS